MNKKPTNVLVGFFVWKGNRMNFKERSALIERAKTMSIIDVAKQLGMELEKTGRSYQWTEHDSLVLVPDKNNFYWNSRSDGGDALKLVQMVRDVGFIEATEILGEMEGIPSAQADQAAEPRSVFAYKLKEHKVMNAGEKYLTEERGLTQETIDFFKEQGVLAQASYTTDFEKKKSEPVLVFKGLSNGEVAGVSLQGVWKNEAYGKREHLKRNLGDGYAGFRVAVGSPSKNPKERPLKVKVFESPIDLMSYYQLHQAVLEDTLLVSTNGLKKGAISYAVADWLNPSMANEQKRRLLDFLNDNQTYEKEAIKVDLAVDNDQAGQQFTENIGWNNLEVSAEFPQNSGQENVKDWNDVVKLAKQSKTKVSNEPMTRGTNKELFTDYQQAFTDVQSYTKTEQAKWLLELAKQPMDPVVYEDFLYPEGMVPENWPVQAGVSFDGAANQQQAILKAIDVTADTMADPEFVQGLELGNSPHPATASEVYQEPSQLFDDNGNLYDDEMAMGDLLNDMKDYLNPPVELTTQEAAILSAVDPRLISNAHQETVSTEKVAELQNDSAMDPQSRKALKSMKKSIVNDGALSIGYFQGVKSKMLELDPDILKKTMASAGGWVAETLTTNADLAMADKPNEFDNVLVTEMVRNLNYQDFKEVAPFFFNYQVSQEDILATPVEASPRNKMAIENGGLTDHIRFELPDSLIQANEGLEQGEKNILAYNPLTDDILAMEGGRPDLFIMNSQWEEKASIELSASDLLERAQIGIQDKAFQLLEQYGEKQYANDFISMSDALQLEHSDLTFSDDEMKAALQEVDRNKAFDDLIDCKKAQQKVTRKRGLKM